MSNLIKINVEIEFPANTSDYDINGVLAHIKPDIEDMVCNEMYQLCTIHCEKGFSPVISKCDIKHV